MRREDLTKSIASSALAQIDVEEPSQVGGFIEDITAGVQAAAVVEEVRVGVQGFKEQRIKRKESERTYDPKYQAEQKKGQNKNLISFLDTFSAETAVENNNKFYENIMKDIESSITNTYIDADGNLQNSPFQVDVYGTDGSSAREQGREYLKQIRAERTK